MDVKNKIVLDFSAIKNYTQEIIRQMNVSGWSPDYVVGVNERGMIPAMLISQYLEIPVYSLVVNEEDSESNGWMPEDALGYNTDKVSILLIDGVNDTGERIKWIKNDWMAGCLPNDPRWLEIWGNNVKFAAIINNLSSSEEIHYGAVEIPDNDQDYDIQFPHENWWIR